MITDDVVYKAVCAFELAPHEANDYVAMRLALEAVETMRDKWHTIETAPRDGSYVLLSGYDMTVCQGGWVEKSGRYAINGWTRFNSTDFVWGPTHWMPLPAAPKPDNV